MLTDADIARLQAYWLAIINLTATGQRVALAVPPVPWNAAQPAGVC